MWFKLKHFLISKYYMLGRMFTKLFEIYSWLYSAFFDTTEEFERKYSKYSSSKYKRQKQQNSYSFYTNFDRETKYSKFPKEETISKKEVSNNSFTNDPKYNQFFLDSDYDILGVHYNSDFKTMIRPAYIKLINKYHEDKLTLLDKVFNRKLYSEISKRINLAYDNLKREHKH